MKAWPSKSAKTRTLDPPPPRQILPERNEESDSEPFKRGNPPTEKRGKTSRKELLPDETQNRRKASEIWGQKLP